MVPIPWAKIVDPLTIITKGKLFRENKKENKDLLPVMWFVAPE